LRRLVGASDAEANGRFPWIRALDAGEAGLGGGDCELVGARVFRLARR